jgi:rhomboid protease GluP
VDDQVEAALAVAGDRAAAEEWSLVLVAEGLNPSIHRTQAGFAVSVPMIEAEAAGRALESYRREQLTPDAPPPEPVDRIGQPERFVAVVVGLALVMFFSVTGPRDPAVAWFAEGSADASRVLGGELWRTVTALCLHADLGHVLSNALFGTLFLAAACAGFGPGVALALTLAAGAGGNLANAIFHGPDHISVGASTAVFGAVGLLGGRGVALRIRRGEIGMRMWVPIAAGLALVAMLGTGDRSDVWAHLFGFLSGGFLGIPASLAWAKPASTPVQIGALALSGALVLYSWRLAGV